ncbi:hypothetical protein [Pseudoneobacillus sp. C159]
MNKIDFAFAIYLILFGLAFFISYKYGSYLTRKTGLIFPPFFIAGMINFVLGVLTIIGWVFFTWQVNEFLFFGGLVLGVGLLLVGEVILIILLLLRRKSFYK